MLRGIDVSHYQKDVNWLEIARDDIQFAFAKATEGLSYVDPSFQRNWTQMREAELARGAYHLGRPGSDPETQAEHFAAVVGGLSFLDLPPVLDLEVSDGHPTAAVLDWARAFINRAESLFQRELMIYTGGFWRLTLGNPKDSFFGIRPLWLAAYNQNPVVPASWTRWTFWQYTDGTQNVPSKVAGVNGPVDQSRFAGTLEELRALCSAPKPIPDPIVPSQGPPDRWPGIHFVWPRSPVVAGDAVRRWQTQMRRLGYQLDSDGTYGPGSKSACSAFQKERGLVVDGIVGRKTWEACFANSDSEPYAGQQVPDRPEMHSFSIRGRNRHYGQARVTQIFSPSRADRT